MRCIEVKSVRDIKRFIAFPDKLQGRKSSHTDKRLEKKLLTNKYENDHIKEIIGYMVEDNQGNIMARSILTVYGEDTSVYLGFFESVPSKAAVKCLMDMVEGKAREIKAERIVGPVNVSIWHGYRFKTDNFDKTYFCEPYNPEFYSDLWKSAGFEVCDRYYSNKLRIPTDDDVNKKYLNRLKGIGKLGYRIRNTNRIRFKKDLGEVYCLITKLYGGFPAYKPIGKKEFMEKCLPLRWILKYDMVFLAYKEGRLKGFMICVPNFYNKDKGRRSKGIKEYVMLYLGVEKDSLGLGAAFAELCRRQLAKKRCTCISALIHSGNISGTFYQNLAIERYEYVLMQKKLLKYV